MPKQTNKEKALAALLAAPSITEAAKKCGLSEETIYRFLKEKDFLADYREARLQIVEASINDLQQASKYAVYTLKKNLKCGNPAVEIRAAQIILDNSIKGVELIDITERLETLENAVETQNRKS